MACEVCQIFLRLINIHDGRDHDRRNLKFILKISKQY